MKLSGCAIIAAFILLYAEAKAFTAVVSGNWSSSFTWGGVAPGNTVIDKDIIIPSGITVSLDKDVAFSGSQQVFVVNGILNGPAHSLRIKQGSLSGSGTIEIADLEFGSSASTFFKGRWILDKLKNSSVFLFLAANAAVADTLFLEAGTLSLNPGSDLLLKNNSTIQVNKGSLAFNGGSFNPQEGYNIMYTGHSKISGTELNNPALKNLYIQLNDPSQTITLGSGSVTVNGDIIFSAGNLNFSRSSLTLYGNINMAAGSLLVSSGFSDLSIKSNMVKTGRLKFSPGSSLNNFNISISDSSDLKLNGSLNISGRLNLANGTLSLEQGSALSMGAGSIIQRKDGMIKNNEGAFITEGYYNVEYTGGSKTTGIELSGTGLNSLVVRLDSASARVTLSAGLILFGRLSMIKGKFVFNGNSFTLNGTFHQSVFAPFLGDEDAELVLNLTTSSGDTLYFDPAGQELKRFTFNLMPGGTLTMGSALGIRGQLFLVNGMLDILRHDFILYPGASISGYDDSRYIITSDLGRLRIYIGPGSMLVTFPVGTVSNYTPLSIQQNLTGGAGDFMVRVMDGVYTRGISGDNTAVSLSVVDKTWVVETSAGIKVNMNLKLGWKAVNEVNSFNRNTAGIRHYINSAWDSYTTGIASGEIGGIYSLTRMGITSPGLFTVVDNTMELLGRDNRGGFDLEIYPNPATDIIHVDVPGASDLYQYEIIDIPTGKILFTSEGKNDFNTFDVSTLHSGYYLVRAINFRDNRVITKRFIKS